MNSQLSATSLDQIRNRARPSSLQKSVRKFQDNETCVIQRESIGNLARSIDPAIEIEALNRQVVVRLPCVWNGQAVRGIIS